MSQLLNKLMNENPNRKTVTVYEDDLRNTLHQYEEAESERAGISTLMYEFIQQNGMSSKFYNFLEEKKKEDVYYCDIDFLMLDYKDEN
jgi:hypothetical protein